MLRPVVVHASEPPLVTVPNVELFRVGEDWQTSTGTFTFTEEDVASAIAAQDNPHFVAPVIKFGHTDPRFNFDGEFSVGRIKNIRTPDGVTCVGDYVGVPTWLAKVLPTAYPRRSIEGEWKGMAQKDQPTWDGFYLTGLALLGAYLPAIQSLADLELFWRGEDPPMYDAETGDIVLLSTALDAMAQEADDVKVAASRTGPTSRQTTVAAQVAVEDVRRLWWEEVADDFGYWSWITAMYVDPAEIIVDDGEGNLYRQSYSIDGDDITFGDAEKVKIQYIPAARVAAGVRGQQEAIAAYASRDEALSGIVRATTDDEPLEGDVKLSEKALKALGLDSDATEEQINEALEKMEAVPAQEPAEADPPVQDAPGNPPAVEDPPATTEVETDAEGRVLVDAAAWRDQAARLARIEAAEAKRENERREGVLAAAVKAGKFPKSRMDHYRAMLAADPAGAEDIIKKLAPGMVPVEAVAVAEDEANTQGEKYPAWMKPAASAPVPAAELPSHIQREGSLTIINA